MMTAAVETARRALVEILAGWTHPFAMLIGNAAQRTAIRRIKFVVNLQQNAGNTTQHVIQAMTAAVTNAYGVNVLVNDDPPLRPQLYRFLGPASNVLKL